jgi:DNA repair exonuclease SbcCD ATPase subunit
MIIQSIHAQNVLKYRRLRLDRLPERGLIGISGDNESGKTAIVETACFALFGRTFSLAPEAITKVIRWGEPCGSVDLTFTAQDGVSYVINRQIDSENRQSARLTRVEGTQLVAKGLKSVLDALTEICGFDYGEFVETLYLAQRDTAVMHPLSASAKAITGVTAMEQVSRDLQDYITGARESINEAQQSLSVSSEALEALVYDEKVLPDLESNRKATEAARVQEEEQIQALQYTISSIKDSLTATQQGVEKLADMRPDHSLVDWVAKMDGLEEIIQNLEQALAEQQVHQDPGDVAQPLKGFAADLRKRLADLEALNDQATMTREHLLYLVGDAELGDVPGDEEPLPVRMTNLQEQEKKARGRRARGWIGALVLLVLAMVGWGLWFPVIQMPNSVLGQMEVQWLTQNFTAWDAQRHGNWVLAASVVVSVFVLWFLIQAISASSRISQTVADQRSLRELSNRLRQQVQAIEAVDEVSLPQALLAMEQTDDDRLTQAVASFKSGSGAPFVDQQPQRLYRQELLEKLKDTSERLLAQEKRLEEEFGDHNQVKQEHNNRVADLERTLIFERERKHQANELRGVIHDLQKTVAEHDHQIKVRDLAGELIAGSVHQSLEQFNRDLRIFMGRVMPQLTKDRYHYLQIDPDLNISVFSCDKHDLVGWGEISTGTQQQILLALRLALSAALAEVIGGERGQFVILDEPFAFYDATRLHDSLEALPKVSDKLTQFWLISQEFHSSEPFALHIECGMEDTELAVAGALN